MYSIIVAFDKNQLIGKDNDLPWHYSKDLKYFKQTTKGKTVLMGLNTFHSILSMNGKPLPNRKNIVASLEEFSYPEVEVTRDIIKYIKNPIEEEVFIIGGKSIYALTLPYVDRLYITHIDKEHEGNVFFPDINWDEWNLIQETQEDFLRFCVYERK